MVESVTPFLGSDQTVPAGAGSSARPVCLVLSPAPLASQWRSFLENAGFQVEVRYLAGCSRPSLVVVFSGFAPTRMDLAWPGHSVVPTLLVTACGAAVLTDSTGEVHLIPSSRLDELSSLLRRSHPVPGGQTQMIGESDAARNLRLRVARVGASEASVLVTGESGTGKELVVSMLHEHSHRCRGPLVCINCAALPDTLVESELFGHERGAFTGASSRRDGAFIKANAGTLFLDEIGDMSLYSQAKLLRAIESRRVALLGGGKEIPIDVRIVAASNRDLHLMMRKGTFREDLYFRLAVVEIRVPPLRDRVTDIPLLVNHLVRELSSRSGFLVQGASDLVLTLLKDYAWPGNIRELKNLVEAALVTCTGSQIEVTDLPQTFCQRLCLPGAEERDRILTTLKSVNGNKSVAAKRLHWSRVTLYRKLASHGIEYASAVETGDSG